MPASTISPAPPGSFTDDDVTDGLAAIAETFTRPDAAGVAVLDGFGVRLRVERGHLEASDGLGEHRRARRWSRADRSLHRVVILGDGYVTTDALRFARATRTSLVVLDDDGVTLATATPGLDDARPRRAQVAAAGTETGLAITRHLLGAKLAGQTGVARDLGCAAVADRIDLLATEVKDADTLDDARDAERRAAQLYWQAWADAGPEVRFIARDAGRVPASWRRFDGRRSALRAGNSNQRAERPLNALLNYCYRLGEIETRLALIAVGLDPGLGFLHADYPGRDSLALDVLEAIRPSIERYVARLVSGRTFRRADFAEQTDGHVRVLAPLSHTLAETMPTWARAVAPHVEAVAHVLTDTIPGRTVKRTPLTSTRRRVAFRRVPGPIVPPAAAAPMPAPTCHGCGAPLGRSDARWCLTCLPAVKRRAVHKAGAASQDARRRRRANGEPDQSPEARAKIGDAIGRRDAEARAWDVAHPALVVDAADFAPIRARLAEVPVSRITATVGLSKSYADRVRAGTYTPHARHWSALAELAGVPCPFDATPSDALDPTWWREVVVPALGTVSTTAITAATGLSGGSASMVRRGLRDPHPRHWRPLAELAGVPVPGAPLRPGGTVTRESTT